MASKIGSSLWLSYLPVASTDLKALYTEGEDHRLNLFQADVPEDAKKQAESVACLVESRYLTKSEKGYEFKDVKTLTARFGGSKPFGPSALFSGEFSLGFGTAFLVAEKLVLTAGHCVFKRGTHEINNEHIDKTRLIFGFRMQTATQPAPLAKSKVCKILKIVEASPNPEAGDWALLELKKRPEGIFPLPIDFTNVVHEPISIYMLGHPSGLPLKYTHSGKVAEKESEDKTQFQAVIDAFAGNSGSPIFNMQTKKVIGILVAGNTDYDTMGLTAEAHRVTPEEIQKKGYEKCQRTTTLPDRVLEKIDLRKKEQRQKAIDSCTTTLPQLLQSKKTDEAIEILKPLAEEGVQAANCALAALIPDATKVEKYKQKALKSGFFAASTLDGVIQSVMVMVQDPQSFIAKFTADEVKLEGSATRVDMTGPGGHTYVKTYEGKGQSTGINIVGNVSPALAGLFAKKPEGASEKKQ